MTDFETHPRGTVKRLEAERDDARKTALSDALTAVQNAMTRALAVAEQRIRDVVLEEAAITEDDIADGLTPAYLAGYAAGKNYASLALREAHMLLCWDFQAMLKPPSECTGEYEQRMYVWNLEPEACDLMTAAQRDMYDALMKLKPPTAI